MSQILPVAMICAHSPIIHQFFDATLSKSFDTIAVSSMEDLIDRMRYIKADLVIIDEKAGKGSLVEPINQLRLACNAPILVVTGNLKKSHHRQLLTAGVTDFIHEPLESVEVEKCIGQAMKQKDIKNKVTGLVSQIPRVRDRLDRIVSGYVNEDRASSIAQSSLKTSSTLGALLIEIDPAEDTDKWQLIDAYLPKEVESIVPMGKDKRLVLVRNISKEVLIDHASKLRSIPKLRVGWAFLPKGIQGTGNQYFTRLLNEAKENCS